MIAYSYEMAGAYIVVLVGLYVYTYYYIWVRLSAAIRRKVLS